MKINKIGLVERDNRGHVSSQCRGVSSRMAAERRYENMLTHEPVALSFAEVLRVLTAFVRVLNRTKFNT